MTICITLLFVVLELFSQKDLTPSMLNDSMIEARKRDHNASVQFGKEGLRLAKQMADTLMLAVISDNLSGTYILMGKNDSALIYLNEALYWYQFCGSDKDMLWCRFYSGIIHAQQGLPDTAIYIYQDILQYSDIKEISNLYPMVLINLGNAYYHKAMYNSAASVYVQSRDYYRIINDTSGFISSSINLGGVLNTVNHFDSAVVVLLEGLYWAEQNKNILRKASLQVNLCESWQGLGKFNDALKTIEEVIVIREGAKDSIGLSNSYRTKGNLLIGKGEYERANNFFMKSLKIDEALSLPVNMAYTYCLIGKSLQWKGDFFGSIAYFQQGYDIAEEIKAGQEMKMALINQAISWSALGDLDQANYYLKRHDNLMDSLQYIDLITFTNQKYPLSTDAKSNASSTRRNWHSLLFLSFIVNLFLLYMIFRARHSRNYNS
ncbi:MAG: hypothetical protein LBH92_02530 [Bacteroidales bacterium]|nr:hypothetical protein [Bacteroidales bacterium]